VSTANNLSNNYVNLGKSNVPAFGGVQPLKKPTADLNETIHMTDRHLVNMMPSGLEAS